MSTFLWEIGCEEIPARMLPEALTSFGERLANSLEQAGLAPGPVTTLGTPRRLALLLENLADRQQDRQEIRRGPPVDRAFDGQGKPTGAAIGFAKSCGVDVTALAREEMGKGIYLVFRENIPGRPVREVLPMVMDTVLREFAWPKSMRWGSGEFRFVRPILSITAILDDQVLPFTLAKAGDGVGLTSSRTVAGHRFVSPGPHPVTTPGQYRELLRQHHVMVDLEERKQVIRAAVTRLAADVGGQALLDEGLLSENACLTEWPVALLGRFDAGYLTIPKEVLVTSMKNHQKYFAITLPDGRLSPHFVAIANMAAPDPQVLVKGYQRVLKARLEDAAFYWAEDRKKSLASRLDSLKNVVFQAKLGTLFDKTQRVRHLSHGLAQRLLPAGVALAEQAAWLCKCDLVTGMVGEFPELQGIMGGHYARHDGEAEAVAMAMAEHYRPQGAADDLPVTPLGRVISLADKLDTLAGCFGVGLAPTGAKDPFALRRAALGVIRMVLAGEGVHLALRQVLATACDLYVRQGVLQPSACDPVVEGVLTFFHGRLDPWLRSQGFEYDVIDAVLALGLDDLLDIQERVRSLARFKGEAAFASLAAANKRIANILTRSREEGMILSAVAPDLLLQEAEQGLFQATGEVARVIADAGRDYGRSLEALAGLRQPIDQFFDIILVMDPDTRLRANRLALLNLVRETFRLVADISRLTTESP